MTQRLQQRQHGGQGKDAFLLQRKAACSSGGKRALMAAHCVVVCRRRRRRAVSGLADTTAADDQTLYTVLLLLCSASHFLIFSPQGREEAASTLQPQQHAEEARCVAACSSSVYMLSHHDEPAYDASFFHPDCCRRARQRRVDEGPRAGPAAASPTAGRKACRRSRTGSGATAQTRLRLLRQDGARLLLANRVRFHKACVCAAAACVRAATEASYYVGSPCSA